MKYLTTALFLTVNCCLNHLYAQPCQVRGRIIDSLTREAIAYSNIVIYNEKDSAIVDGTVTGASGDFRIEKLTAGRYYLNISFIGYQPVVIRDLLMQPGIRDLGEIALQVLTENLNEIMVTGAKPSLSYQVDRKVIDAGSFPGAEVAMDLLENLPSVQLDFEGKLTYRGEGTFIVYINGHPVANGEEKLRQLPASQIDKIEIITNPSAKYRAEGTAGIIQVILKKNRLEGYAINASLRVNTREGYDWHFSVDNKKKKSGWYVQGQLSRYVWADSKSSEHQVSTGNDNLYEVLTRKESRRHKDYSYLETGMNFDLTAKDYINFSGYIYPHAARQVYQDEGFTLEKENNASLAYDLKSRVNLDFRYVGTTFTWDHFFNKKRSHLLSAYLDYSGYLQRLRDRQVDTKTYKDFTERTGYIGSEQNDIVLEGKLNYTLPVTEKMTIDAGAQINTDDIPKLTSVSGTFDEQENITKFEDEPLNQAVHYSQDIYAAYLTVKKQWGNLEIQAGARAEQTKRKSDYSYDSANTGQKVSIPEHNTFTDFFPSAHLAYSFSSTKQFYLSYSRRIHRPNYWSLVPLIQYETPYCYHRGNGNLKTSFTNAWEGGFKKSHGKDFVSSEIFVRQTEEAVQYYFRPGPGNILVRSPENIGKTIRAGGELMTGVDLFSWWNVNLSGSLYYYKLKVDFEGIKDEITQIKSDSRLNMTFLLPSSFTLKWDVAYISPMKNVQTKRDGYFVSNLAIKKAFMKSRWNATLVLNDLFSGEQYDEITTGTGFRIDKWKKERPYVSFTIGYALDNQNK